MKRSARYDKFVEDDDDESSRPRPLKRSRLNRNQSNQNNQRNNDADKHTNSNDADIDALPFLGWNQRDIHILCLGYLRNMLSSRIYNVDDVGSIVFKYLQSLTIDFMTIYNREY